MKACDVIWLMLTQSWCLLTDQSPWKEQRKSWDWWYFYRGYFTAVLWAHSGALLRFVTEDADKTRQIFSPCLKSNLAWPGCFLWFLSSWQEREKEAQQQRDTCLVWTFLLRNYQPSQMFPAICLYVKLCTFVCLMTVLWNTLSRWTLI